MTQRSVTHATFTIERLYDASPAQVFAAWSSVEAKSRWFAADEKGWKTGGLTLDFRTGGRESVTSTSKDGIAHVYNALYHDIVANERIIFSYDMHLDRNRISVSLATVMLEPRAKGTKLTFTEQGAFLDGHDDAGRRERGTEGLLDSLGRRLQQGIRKT
ncbi:MAG TPA: SRPBCC family protein [Hypericibacter adhaerens]|jgi:uncharacterized protein YndB with AHSA1/START domain|nr:SRPBCC family protein [Hypericibacter adhaerens]HWA46211.1 SRPBCC family protein [Hypericibacter adhaerens]